MILLAIILTMLFALPFGYAVGRVHGINQSVNALDKYGKALALAEGKDPGELDYATLLPGRKQKKEKPKNVHDACGEPWGKWENGKIKIVNSNGAPTGAVVQGQIRFCDGCGLKQVRTDIRG